MEGKHPEKVTFDEIVEPVPQVLPDIQVFDLDEWQKTLRERPELLKKYKRYKELIGVYDA